jgi:beta-lactamase regulating signal transducer with metallopeptidase domain
MRTLASNLSASAALWIVVRATLLLAVAAIVQVVLHRRTSAAMRHLIWTIALTGALAMPLLSLTVPEWTFEVSAPRPATPAAPLILPLVETHTAPGPSPADPLAAAEPSPTAGAGGRWRYAAGGIYAAGLLAMLVQLAMQLWRVRRLTHAATEIDDTEWVELLAECAAATGVQRRVRLLRSRERAVPMTFGTLRPAIVIPSVADAWPDNRRRAVLLHELAHIIRLDCLTQTLALMACAFYWFNPASWWVSRRLRIERELACDDLVIAAGTEAREYAGHLLEIAYSFGGHGAPAVAVSMARPRQLEGRMLAALDAARDRRVPRLRFRVASAATAGILLIPLAGARPSIIAADRHAESAPVALFAAAPGDQDLQELVRQIEEPVKESAMRMVRQVAAAAGVAQDNLPGTWEIRPAGTNGVVHLRLVEANSSSGSNIRIDQLDGLTPAQLAGAGGPIHFRLKRDAGTFTFEGVIRNGVGAGTFSFSADPNFPAELAKRGFARPTAPEQYQMARHDVGFAFVDELIKQGYSKPETPELVRAGQHGVDVSYLRDMGALGYRLASLDPLITLRDHGITPDYVRELESQGYKGLSADDLRHARDHGITPDYVRGMRDAGYGSLAMSELITARDHGVTPEFVRDLAAAGHGKLALDQVLRVRDHGVSPEYARDMRQLGYSLAVDDLIRARDHGVTAEYVRAMAALGYSGLPIDALVRVRDHGVTAEYAQELKALGYDHLAAEDLVSMRDHGLTPDRIRAANARAGSHLPVDLLKSLAAGGMR